MPKKSFKINSDIYGEENIEQMVQDFSDFFLDYKDGILDVSGNTDEEIDEIFHESMNYLIVLHNENI